LNLVSSEPAVVAHGVSYLHAALPMLLFLGPGFAVGAYRNGAGTPRYALVSAIVQLPVTALATYALVLGPFGLPALDATGAGLGATLGAFVALLVDLLQATTLAPVPGLLHPAASRAGMRLILAIGLPVGVQQSLVYLGTAVLLSIVAQLGNHELAAMNIMLSMMLLAILPVAGIGTATATLVGTAIGCGDPQDARRWGWQAASLGVLPILAFAAVLALAPVDVLGLFIADAATIAVAATPLGVLAVGLCIDTFGRILGFALRGAGATRLVTMVAFTLQWGVQLPLSWFVGVVLGYGLVGIAVVRLLLFAIEASIVALMWRNGFWARV